MNYSSYIGRVLQSFSQLGNALVGGDPDISISARTGYESHHTDHWWWDFAENLIDFAFYPIDGPDHCYDAWQKDKLEDFSIARGSKLSLAGAAGLQLAFCIPIAVLSYTYLAIKTFVKWLIS